MNFIADVHGENPCKECRKKYYVSSLHTFTSCLLCQPSKYLVFSGTLKFIALTFILIVPIDNSAFAQGTNRWGLLFGLGVSSGAENGNSFYSQAALLSARIGAYGIFDITKKADSSEISRYVKVALGMPSGRAGYFQAGPNPVKVSYVTADLEVLLIPLAVPVIRGVEFYLGAGGGVSTVIDQQKTWQNAQGELNINTFQPYMGGEVGFLTTNKSSWGIRLYRNVTEYPLREIGMFVNVGFDDIFKPEARTKHRSRY